MRNMTLIAERPVRASRAHEVSGPIRSILLLVQNDAKMMERLQLALSLARATGSHLRCLQVTPIEAYVAAEALGIFALDKAMAKIDAQEQQLRSDLETHLRAEDVSWDYEGVAGYAAPELIRRAALADLVIACRNAHSALAQRPEVGILGDIVMGMRTPVLIPGAGGSPFDPFGTAIVAWNGSFEAANAVRTSIGMLKLASAVRVVRFTEEKDYSFPDLALTQYLSRHAIHAEIDVRTVRFDFADDLVDYSSSNDGSFLVMGGYGHSRAGELLFGGVTRRLLRECPLPLVVAH